MATITVKVRSDIGDPGTHNKLGPLSPGQTVTIEEDNFGAGLFERPTSDYLSPLELADKARGEELKQSVGTFEYVEIPASVVKKTKTTVPVPSEVTNVA